MQTLDVALGLVFVYLMLSLVCTAANELLSQWFNSRATTLRAGIDALLLNITDAVTTESQERLKRAADGAAEALAHLEGELRTGAETVFAEWKAAARAAEDTRLVFEQVCSRARAAERGGEGSTADCIPELDVQDPARALGAARNALDSALAIRVSAERALEAARPGATTRLAMAREHAERAAATHALATFYDHPLIAGLSQLPWRLMPWGEKVRIPSYIPTQTFTLALLDTIAPASANSATPLLEVRRALAWLPEHVQRPLLLALNEAAGDLDTFRQSLSVWYDNTMERVSGLYKRKTKVTVLMFACFVTLFTNANTLRIVDALSTNPVLRESLAAQAEAAAASTATRTAPASLDSARAALAQSLADVKALGIPMGYVVPDSVAAQLAMAHWLSADTATLTGDAAPRTIPSKLRLYISLYPPQIASGLVGLLLTMLALSLGAPFWFDILNKIVNVRAVGRTPAENAKVKANQAR